MTRTPVIRLALLATALLLTAFPLGMRTAAAQDGTPPPPPGESELAPQLPAVVLPTMNEMSYTFEIDAAWRIEVIVWK